MNRRKKTSTRILIKSYVLIFLASMLSSCSSDNDSTSFNLSDEKTITSLVFTKAKNAELTEDVQAVIDEEKLTITVTLPYKTDVTNLVPTISISELATVSPKSDESVDLTSPVILTVTAQNGLSKLYTLTVENPSSDREALEILYNANRGNTLSWDLDAVSMDSWSGVTTTEGRVTHLALSSKNLSTIPDEFGNLSSLKTLDISENAFTSFPVALEQLENLESLNMGNNQISTLPTSIENLRNKLTILNLDENGLTSLPAEIGKLENLQELSIQNNKLRSLPDQIVELIQLVDLDASNNILNKLPENIGNLVNLRNLTLLNNLIVVFPKSIKGLSNLEVLNLQYNQLRAMPDMSDLDKLITLNLSHNMIFILSESIGNIDSLENLKVNNNEIQVISLSIKNLSNLVGLDLSSNMLPSIPEEIGDLTTLKALKLTKNNFSEIPQVVCDLANTGTIITVDSSVTCK